MRPVFRAIPMVGAVALLPPVLAACSGPATCASNTNVNVNGKNVTFTTNSTTMSDLSSSGVTVSAISPASKQSSGKYQFPITGGKVNNSSLSGSINLSGGLKFSAGGHSESFTNPVIDSQTGVVSATFQGHSVQLFQVALSSATKQYSSLQINASGITTTLSTAAALTLDNGLTVTAFHAGSQIGNFSSDITYTC